jgi:hypothetical protein
MSRPEGREVMKYEGLLPWRVRRQVKIKTLKRD